VALADTEQIVEMTKRKRARENAKIVRGFERITIGPQVDLIWIDANRCLVLRVMLKEHFDLDVVVILMGIVFHVRVTHLVTPMSTLKAVVTPHQVHVRLVIHVTMDFTKRIVVDRTLELVKGVTLQLVRRTNTYKAVKIKTQEVV